MPALQPGDACPGAAMTIRQTTAYKIACPRCRHEYVAKSYENVKCPCGLGWFWDSYGPDCDFAEWVDEDNEVVYGAIPTKPVMVNEEVLP